ncbi:MAG: retention module-containing protein, partial [Rhodoferax sp.]|nr:retention module-containing protein [Rhodoferax sp.]
MAQIASVAAITGTGKAFAVNEQGVSRELKAGDVLQKGETIRTVGDVQVEMLMDDGRLLAVAPNQVLRLDENVSESDQRPTAQDSAVGAPAATADTVLQALERGTDLSTQLEATAAGLGGGGGADGGSTFVQLLRITEGVDPLSYNYNYTAPDLAPDLQSNPETLTATTMVLTADPAVFEGGGVTYTVTLVDPALTDMTVTLSNGAVILIPAGSNTGSVLVPVQGDDVYKDGETLQASVDTVQGGGFLEITVTDQNVTTVVNDTIDTTPVSVGVTVLGGEGDVNNVIEGNELTFRFSVDAAPQTDLVLNVTIGGVEQTVTIAAGSLFTDVTVNSRADENYVQGATTVTGTVNSVSLRDSGNFENLSIVGASATATIVDDGDVTRASISANDVTENDAGVTFNISLSNVPQGAATAQVLVGETTYNVAIGANGTGTLFIPTNDPDAYKDPSSVTATVTGVTGGNYEVVNVASATATADITDIVGEGDTTTVSLATSNVNEDAASVTFTATLSNPGESAVTITTNLGDIVIAAGDTEGTLVVNTKDSDVYVDPSSLTATVSAVIGGNFEAVDFSAATATARITDTIDITGVTVTTADVNENAESVTFNFALTNAPDGTSSVTVQIAGETGTRTVELDTDGKGSLTITTANPDVYVDSQTVTATVTAINGGNFEATSVEGANATAKVTDINEDGEDTTTV